VRNLGYEVLTALDGRSALPAPPRDPEIDVLFTELARTAARLRPHLRILLASGYPKSALSSEHGIRADGDFPFLSKPYRRSELAKKLRKIAAD
jgi:hypothetical protein